MATGMQISTADGVAHGFIKDESDPSIWMKAVKQSGLPDGFARDICCIIATCGLYACCWNPIAAFDNNDPNKMTNITFNDTTKEVGVREPNADIKTYSYASIVPKVEMKHTGLTVNNQPQYAFFISQQSGESIQIGTEFSMVPGLTLQSYLSFVGARLGGAQGANAPNNDSTPAATNMEKSVQMM
eukprot:jgi/Bigna1/81267/fgenesh1_pg.79_\